MYVMMISLLGRGFLMRVYGSERMRALAGFYFGKDSIDT